jgi:hypothetical protein
MPLVGEVPPAPAAVRKRSTPTASAAPKKSVESPTASKAVARTESLMEIAGIGQGIALMTGNFADAETIEMHARPLLSAVAKLGDIHPQFGESIDKAEFINPYLAVFAAAIPLTLQFMANHGRIDSRRARIAGIQDPTLLANRQSAKVAQAQAQMIREQREAAEEAQRAQASLQAEMEAFASMANAAT